MMPSLVENDCDETAIIKPIGFILRIIGENSILKVNQKKAMGKLWVY